MDARHEEAVQPFPFGEGKNPAAIEAPRLQIGALNLVDIATSTMANVAPSMSFYFSFALIAGAAGVGSPLTIVVAIVAIALLGNTLSEFSRAIPSTGSFITFIGKTFGPVMAVTTTIVVCIGYILAVSTVIDISGGWTQIILKQYLGINVPWQILTLFFVVVVFFLMVRGVHLSTRWAGGFFLLEMIVLVLVSVIILITHAGKLSFAPFNPGNITGGLAGIGLGFPIAVYMFIGWENSASLAEETANPRRNIPRAIYASILLMGLSYLLFAYATVVAFNYNVNALSTSAVPFIDAAKSISGFLALLAYIAGFTSTISCLIAASNAQSRLIFNAAREGLLPSWIAKVHATNRTPWTSFLVYFIIGLGIVYILGWTTDPIVFFGQIGTLGTILVALTYLVSNIALPFFYRRYHPDQFSFVKHLILPVLGILAIGFPLWGLIQPGQPSPFNIYPWVALGIIVLALIYAFILSRINPALGDRVGSIVADRE